MENLPEPTGRKLLALLKTHKMNSPAIASAWAEGKGPPLPQATMLSGLNRLAADGLIRRVVQADRRERFNSITPKGREVLRIVERLQKL